MRESSGTHDEPKQEGRQLQASSNWKLSSKGGHRPSSEPTSTHLARELLLPRPSSAKLPMTALLRLGQGQQVVHVASTTIPMPQIGGKAEGQPGSASFTPTPRREQIKALRSITKARRKMLHVIRVLRARCQGQRHKPERGQWE